MTRTRGDVLIAAVDRVLQARTLDSDGLIALASSEEGDEHFVGGAVVLFGDPFADKRFKTFRNCHVHHERAPLRKIARTGLVRLRGAPKSRTLFRVAPAAPLMCSSRRSRDSPGQALETLWNQVVLASPRGLGGLCRGEMAEIRVLAPAA